MKSLLSSLLLIAVLSGCNPETIIVRPGDPVQFAEDTWIEAFVYNKSGQRVRSKAKIPAGWWCLPDDGEE